MGELLKRIEKGNVSLAVFENPAMVEGKKEMILTIQITRGYCNNGVWRNVPHYRERDLAKIKEAIEEYEKWRAEYNK